MRHLQTCTACRYYEIVVGMPHCWNDGIHCHVRTLEEYYALETDQCIYPDRLGLMCGSLSSDVIWRDMRICKKCHGLTKKRQKSWDMSNSIFECFYDHVRPQNDTARNWSWKRLPDECVMRLEHIVLNQSRHHDTQEDT